MVETILTLAIPAFFVACFVFGLGVAIEVFHLPASGRIEGHRVSTWKRDRRTGLPQLPDGWYWDVQLYDPGYSFESMAVSLCQAGGVYGNVITKATFYVHGGRLIRTRIRTHAAAALRKYWKSVQPRKTAEKYVGQYPPQNLNKVR